VVYDVAGVVPYLDGLAWQRALQVLDLIKCVCEGGGEGRMGRVGECVCGCACIRTSVCMHVVCGIRSCVRVRVCLRVCHTELKTKLKTKLNEDKASLFQATR